MVGAGYGIYSLYSLGLLDGADDAHRQQRYARQRTAAQNRRVVSVYSDSMTGEGDLFSGRTRSRLAGIDNRSDETPALSRRHGKNTYI